MTRRCGQRPGPGGLWLLGPGACCSGPPLIAALAAAGALARGELGLGLAVLAPGAMLVITPRRRSPARTGDRRDRAPARQSIWGA